MSPRPGQRCAKGLPKMQKSLRQLKGKDSFSVFQARIGMKMAATPAPIIRERACVEVTLHHVSNLEGRTPEAQRAPDGGEPGWGSTTVTTPCTKSPSSRGGGIGECYNEPGGGAILVAEESMSTAETHQDLVHIPNEMHDVNVFCTDPYLSLALASFAPYAPTEVIASADRGGSQLNMPMSPSAPELPYVSKAGSRLGTPASMVRKSKSSLVMRSSHPRYRNLNGPLDSGARLRESDLLSIAAMDMAANPRSHRVDRPVSLEGILQVGNAALPPSNAPDCRLPPSALPSMCAQKSKTVAAIALPQRTGHQEIDGALDALPPRDPSLSITTSIELTLPFANAPDALILHEWDSALCNPLTERASLTVFDHGADIPVSTFSALADALVMPSVLM
ncbi:hypothetical protein BD414DRAFT_537189 [Trametes punicea]|nr:hypothetical protein BD414DRAFT_537189 [Trametes punicea]